MTNKGFAVGRDGKVRELQHGDVLRDGERLHVPSSMMDSNKTVADREWQAMLDAAEGARDAARGRMVDAITNGWRSDHTPAPSGVADAAVAATDAGSSAHDAYVRSLNDGWKQPA